MFESDHNTTISVENMGASLATDTSSPSDRTRRSLILTVLATGVCIAASRSAATAADEDQPGSDERPQKADLLVASEGDDEEKSSSRRT